MTTKTQPDFTPELLAEALDAGALPEGTAVCVRKDVVDFHFLKDTGEDYWFLIRWFPTGRLHMWVSEGAATVLNADFDKFTARQVIPPIVMALASF